MKWESRSKQLEVERDHRSVGGERKWGADVGALDLVVIELPTTEPNCRGVRQAQFIASVDHPNFDIAFEGKGFTAEGAMVESDKLCEAEAFKLAPWLRRERDELRTLLEAADHESLTEAAKRVVLELAALRDCGDSCDGFMSAVLRAVEESKCDRLKRSSLVPTEALVNPQLEVSSGKRDT